MTTRNQSKKKKPSVPARNEPRAPPANDEEMRLIFTRLNTWALEYFDSTDTAKLQYVHRIHPAIKKGLLVYMLPSKAK